MSEAEQHRSYVNAWKNVVSRDWLFPHHYDYPVEFAEYMKHFEFKTGGDFYCFRGPMSYEADVLHQYKDNIVSTVQRYSPQGHSFFHTIVQVSPEMHLSIEWGYSKKAERDVINVSVYAKNPSDYRKFVTDNAKFEFFEDTKGFGFGNMGAR